MTYKPVLCELKCISRDVKKELESKDDEDNHSLKEEVQFIIQRVKNLSRSEWIMFGIGILMYISIWAIIVFIVPIWLSILFLVVIGILLIYLFFEYIYRVHERCIRHARAKEIQEEG